MTSLAIGLVRPDNDLTPNHVPAPSNSNTATAVSSRRLARLDETMRELHGTSVRRDIALIAMVFYSVGLAQNSRIMPGDGRSRLDDGTCR